MEQDDSYSDIKHISDSENTYLQRLVGWGQFSYRPAYVLGSTLSGALPRAFLRPFEYLAFEYKPNPKQKHQRKEWQHKLRRFVQPWIDITEFYIQKPVANFISAISWLAGTTLGLILSLFVTAPTYQKVTKGNRYFESIKPTIFSQLTQSLVTWCVWGALLGLAAGTMMAQPLLGFVAIGATFGLGALSVSNYLVPKFLRNWLENKVSSPKNVDENKPQDKIDNDKDAKSDYQKRLDSWRNFSYRLAYDMGASLVGAIPQGFLKPLINLSKPTFWEGDFKSAFKLAIFKAINPWSQISIEYIERAAGNLSSLIGIAAGETLGRVLSIFSAAPEYQAVTRDNGYFNRITAGAFGRFIENYRSLAVWGALLGLVLTTGLVGSFGLTAVQADSTVALISATLAMLPRLVFIDSPRLIAYLKSSHNVAAQEMEKVPDHRDNLQHDFGHPPVMTYNFNMKISEPESQEPLNSGWPEPPQTCRPESP
ncbi:MAG: hypothetical protein U1E78_01990 [Gammaproteobacteria bacterium]